LERWYLISGVQNAARRSKCSRIGALRYH